MFRVYEFFELAYCGAWYNPFKRAPALPDKRRIFVRRKSRRTRRLVRLLSACFRSRSYRSRSHGAACPVLAVQVLVILVVRLVRCCHGPLLLSRLKNPAPCTIVIISWRKCKTTELS